MSFFIISDGTCYKKFGTAQDHKRVLEGDKGKNTGGMGAYSPSRLENETLDKKILEKIIEPTLKGLKNLETEFVGFLYAGLMIVKGEPFLIEYNVRMGDPECQTILPRLIKKLEKIKPKNNNYIFHAGTTLKNSKIYSNGGRVLNFVIKSKNLKQSRDELINSINDLNWENGYFRKDIGFKIFE